MISLHCDKVTLLRAPQKTFISRVCMCNVYAKAATNVFVTKQSMVYSLTKHFCWIITKERYGLIGGKQNAMACTVQCLLLSRCEDFPCWICPDCTEGGTFESGQNPQLKEPENTDGTNTTKLKIVHCPADAHLVLHSDFAIMTLQLAVNFFFRSQVYGIRECWPGAQKI